MFQKMVSCLFNLNLFVIRRIACLSGNTESNGNIIEGHDEKEPVMDMKEVNYSCN